MFPLRQAKLSPDSERLKPIFFQCNPANQQLEYTQCISGHLSMVLHPQGERPWPLIPTSAVAPTGWLRQLIS
eukprot:712049-Pelagomonas_calceolata.AAC.8